MVQPRTIPSTSSALPYALSSASTTDRAFSHRSERSSASGFRVSGASGASNASSRGSERQSPGSPSKRAQKTILFASRSVNLFEASARHFRPHTSCAAASRRLRLNYPVVISPVTRHSVYSPSKSVVVQRFRTRSRSSKVPLTGLAPLLSVLRLTIDEPIRF